MEYWHVLNVYFTCRAKFIAVLTILLFLPSISLAEIELKKIKFIYHDQSPYRDLALKVYDLNWGKSGSNRKIGYGDIEVGAFDINDDGVEEVFLKFIFVCGNYAGFEILIYNIKDGKWRELLSMSGHGVEVVMDPRETYHTLFGCGTDIAGMARNTSTIHSTNILGSRVKIRNQENGNILGKRGTVYSFPENALRPH